MPPIGLGCRKHLFWLTEDKTLTNLFSDYASDKEKIFKKDNLRKSLECTWVQDGLSSWPCQMLPTHSMTITLLIELEKASRIGSNYEHTKTPNLIAFSFGHNFWNRDVSYNTKIRMSSITLRPYQAKLWCYSKSKKSTSFHYIHVLLSVKLLPVGTNSSCTALWNMIH